MRPNLTADTAGVESRRARPGLSLDGVTVRYADVTALDRISLSVHSGEVLCLLGPSGSGKSTLLRVVSGLERPVAGAVMIGETVVSSSDVHIEPERRRVGMVFQDYALFPHLTVYANVAFGLRGRPRTEVQQIVSGLLERLGIGRYASSYPHMLSGGERQRVALARAMAPGPRVLLMDEPFSSLDGRLRDDVRRHAMAFLRDAGTTTLIVTHDPHEAMHLADRIALVRQGSLIQCGRPEELYTCPSTPFAARVFSEINELRGTCRQGRVDTVLGSFDASRFEDGTAVSVCIRPEHLHLSERPADALARVTEIAFLGETDELSLALDGLAMPVTMRVPGRAHVRPGDTVHIHVQREDVLVLPTD